MNDDKKKFDPFHGRGQQGQHGIGIDKGEAQKEEKDPSEMTPKERDRYRKNQIRQGRDDVLYPNGDPSLKDRVFVESQIEDTDERKRAYKDAYRDYMRDNMRYSLEESEAKDNLRELHDEELKELKEGYKGKDFMERLKDYGEFEAGYFEKYRDIDEQYGDMKDRRAYEYGEDLGEADKDSFQGRENQRVNRFKDIYGDDFYEQDGQGREHAPKEGAAPYESKKQGNPFKKDKGIGKDNLESHKKGSSFQDAMQQGQDSIQSNVNRRGLSGQEKGGPGADIER